jgi:hypothetical protein
MASRHGARRAPARLHAAGIHDPQTIDGDHDLYGDGSIRLLATPGQLREICREAPTVVAPTHDTDAAQRVARSQVTAL